MRDRFFEVENCDRCGKPLNGCRIQSMYNHEVLCMDCKEKETQREDYRQPSKPTMRRSGAGTITSLGSA